MFINMDKKNPFIINGLVAISRLPGKARTMPFYIFGIACCFLVSSLLWLPSHAMAGESPQPSFFNSVEVRSNNLEPFTKWRSALARYAKEASANAKFQCTSQEMHFCSYADWIAFLDGLNGKAPLVQLNEVNNRVNQAKYITDSANWGQNDYWATPAEFMSKFGDCEDYAILKYLSLRRLGWKEKDLRVVAVKDLNLKVGHAVLIVFFKHPKTGQILHLLLDNQIKSIANAATIRHYQPVFSINKYFWWRHTPVPIN